MQWMQVARQGREVLTPVEELSRQAPCPVSGNLRLQPLRGGTRRAFANHLPRTAEKSGLLLLDYWLRMFSSPAWPLLPPMRTPGNFVVKSWTR